MELLENNIVVESGQYRQIVLSDDTEHLQANEEHCDIVVKENASLEMYRIQNLDETTGLKTHIHIRQERDSRVHFVVISFNAGDLRNHITVDVDGEGCETQVYGLYLVDKKQHMENYLKINHNVAHCTSDTRFGVQRPYVCRPRCPEDRCPAEQCQYHFDLDGQDRHQTLLGNLCR